MTRARIERVKGRIVCNKRYGTWNFLWTDEDGKNRSRCLGHFDQLPTRELALKRAEALGLELRFRTPAVPLVKELVERYRLEKMPERFSTRYGYEQWIANHILPMWGEQPVNHLQAREVELWLKALPLSPKSKVHLRGVIRRLWEFAMWERTVAQQPNPMDLVTIKGASKRLKKPRSLSEDEFRKFLAHLEEPGRTIALVCVLFGLRISECLALRWSDVDWVGGSLRVQRSIVRQRVGQAKTSSSENSMPADPAILGVLRSWRTQSQFCGEDDWVFASPAKLGRLPVSYPWIWVVFRTGARRANIPEFGTHSLRHTYRSWLDAAGTSVSVQQKLMRHADVRTTMNVYGDVVTNEMAEAHGKVVRMALATVN